jgi:hypothetical protein
VEGQPSGAKAIKFTPFAIRGLIFCPVLRAAALQTASNVVPVLPHYEDYPFAVSIGTSDPMRLYQVFDDRYLMASTELNLLNTLLLSS